MCIEHILPEMLTAKKQPCGMQSPVTFPDNALRCLTEHPEHLEKSCQQVYYSFRLPCMEKKNVTQYMVQLIIDYNRNITTDNWFTSGRLANERLEKKTYFCWYKKIILRYLFKKPEHSSTFGFDGNNNTI